MLCQIVKTLELKKRFTIFFFTALKFLTILRTSFYFFKDVHETTIFFQTLCMLLKIGHLRATLFQDSD